MKDFEGKMSKILLFLLLLLIPTQLGKHFWFDWSLIWGIRIDYLSPTLYLIDLVWLVLMVFNLKFEIFGRAWKKKIFSFKTLVIFGFVVVNILISQNRWIAMYKWLRLGGLVWFGIYVYKNKRLVENYLKKVIPWWLLIEGWLAMGQISKGGSLNGWWWFLGERKFDFSTIGIAQMSVADMGLVRAYGTFSHPNSLAGFLLVGLILWWKYKKQDFNKPETFRSKRAIIDNIWWWLVFWFGVLGIILSGSRTIWILSLVVGVWGWQQKQEKLKNKVKFLALFLVLVLLSIKIIDYNYPVGGFLGGWDENGLIKRGQLNLASLEMVKKSPWLGVGMGNFLVNLPEFQRNNRIFWFQPVHNILLLLLSEIGLLGFLGVIGMAGRKWKWKKWNNWTRIILGVIFVSGMVDHYWLTLPQNMWLLALVLGII